MGNQLNQGYCQQLPKQYPGCANALYCCSDNNRRKENDIGVQTHDQGELKIND